MKYYVTADVHGYFTELKTALAEQGFFEDTEPHKLVILGDLYDRGTEALQLQAFILDLLSNDQVILIRGNHEDLTLDLLHNWNQKSYLQRHHHLNGTVDTVCQLTGFSEREVFTQPDEVGKAFLQNPLIQTVIPALLDFIGDRVIVAHNADFDMTFIQRACDMLGIAHSFTYVDTLTISQNLMPELPKYKLDVVAKAFSLEDFNHHRAD